MPRKQRSNAQTPDAQDRKTAAGGFRVLLVDREPHLAEVLRQCAGRKPLEVVHVGSVAEARKQLAHGRIDLAMIESELPDGSGLALAAELGGSRRLTQTIVMGEKPSLDAAIQAIRAGACDFIVKPLDLQEINERVRQALQKGDRQRLHAQRVRRLRRLCKKLNDARQEVSQQVDILCNDLVTAYQELACQIQQVVQSSEFSVVIRDELDLEKLLRRTLEYVVEKAGPTNAAIFLPSSMDEYTLGGYVNYDCSSKSADILLQHLADVMAPKIAASTHLVHVTDNDQLAYWIGDDSAYLADSHVIAFACRHDNEALAVIALFRDGGTPYTTSTLETCKALAPLLGGALARVIRIHHRAVFRSDGEYGPDPNDDAMPM